MSTQNDSTDPAEVFHRFNMRVDLSDPAVLAFMQGTGIPEERWNEFDRNTPCHTPALKAEHPHPVRFDGATILTSDSDDFPDILRLAGVREVRRYPMRWTERGDCTLFVLIKSDGKGVPYELYGRKHQSRDEVFYEMYERVWMSDPLPFDEIGGAE